jgi:anti-sigma-K factor RskA
MSDKPQDWDRSRDEIISGEYVLGILSEEDRKRVEARIASDPKFAMQVRRWQTNLADFNDEYRDVKPPAELFEKIETRLFAADAPAAKPRLLRSIWNSVEVWRGLALAAIVLAIAIGVTDRFSFFGPPQPDKPLVAELTGMDSPISLVATYDFGSGRLSISPAALKQEQPKSLEVWLIEIDGTTTSLGIMPDNGQGDILITAGMRRSFAEGKTIAITVEPLGGSPSGKPTGPVIALGKTRLL